MNKKTVRNILIIAVILVGVAGSVKSCNKKKKMGHINGGGSK